MASCGTSARYSERPGKLMWLFEPYLQDLYERRQWTTIAALRINVRRERGWWRRWCWPPPAPASWSPTSNRPALVKFHTERRKWLVSYMFGRTCDPECRGKLVDVMLSTYGEAARRLRRAPA